MKPVFDLIGTYAVFAPFVLMLISYTFVHNPVLTQFLGMCPFVGVTSRVDTSLGMSYATAFVVTMSTIVSWLINTTILVPLKIEFLYIVVFILVVASLVQIIEIIMKKVTPALYQALGIYLPLITTNCIVLGTVILAIEIKHFDLFQSAVFAIANCFGFALGLIVMSGIREQLELFDVPKAMRGIPIAFVAAGLISLAFMGFSGLVK